MKEKKQIAVIISLLLQCCHDDPGPCAGKVPTTADFTVMEHISATRYPDWTPYATDTVCTNYLIVEAKQDTAINTSYTWQIGKSSYSKRTLYFDFSSRKAGEDVVPVSLAVQAQPDKSCFPADSGKASSTQSIVFATTSRTVGRYFGTWNGNNADTATIDIYGYFKFRTYPDREYPPGAIPDSTTIFGGYNITGERKVCGSLSAFSGYRQFLDAGGDFESLYAIRGISYHAHGTLGADNNTIVIEVSSNVPEKTYKKFTGNRVK